jgi:hypothetical protein
MITLPSPSGSTAFAGSNITGNYDSNGILQLSITLPSGTTIQWGGSKSELINAAGDNVGDLQAANSIVANYDNITRSIGNQINTETAVQPSQDPEVAYYQQLQAENEAVAAPLTTPPGTDEFDGIDSQIEANANSLKEPPVISDQEVEARLNAAASPNEDFVPVTPEELGSSSTNGVTAPLSNAQGQASSQNSQNIYNQNDWRVRLQLAPGANYLYLDPGNEGILKPLVDTQGVLFPYTPSILVNYAASYDAADIVHSNYKIFQYKNSSVDNFQISCDFTAQDTFEANYLLAVIHFLRSMTKMFYGQDQNPVNGTPPPLCYLTGMGAFQFDRHPLAITSFNYNLPTDVDYIPAGSTPTISGTQTPQTGGQPSTRYGPNISAGGRPPPPVFKPLAQGPSDPTYVPTRMSISIGASPIVSRNDISNNFSLKKYGTGELLRGSKRNGAGIW